MGGRNTHHSGSHVGEPSLTFWIMTTTRKRAAKTTTGGLKRIGPIARKVVREAAALIPAAMPLRGRSVIPPERSGPVISAEPQGASGGDPRRPGQGGRDERAAHGTLREAADEVLNAALAVALRNRGAQRK